MKHAANLNGAAGQNPTKKSHESPHNPCVLFAWTSGRMSEYIRTSNATSSVLPIFDFRPHLASDVCSPTKRDSRRIRRVMDERIRWIHRRWMHRLMSTGSLDTRRNEHPIPSAFSKVEYSARRAQSNFSSVAFRRVNSMEITCKSIAVIQT